MDAQAVFELAKSGGVSLAVKDGLVIAQPASALSDELRSGIRANKEAILALLSEQPLMAIIRQSCEGVIAPEIFRSNLSSEDLADIESGALTVEHLRSFAKMMAGRLTSERGEIPPSVTATTTCRHCGEVPIWPGCLPEVLGCPWCLA